MLRQPLGDPRQPAGDDSSSGVQVEVKYLFDVVIEVAKEIWRLKGAIVRNNETGVILNDELVASVSRMSDRLESAGIEVVDLTGQDHHEGSKYNINHIEEGEGDLFVADTLIPAVRIAGQQVSPATVILGHRGGQS